MNLTEAFKVLDSLTEDTFDLDQAGIAKLSDFEDDNFQDGTILVIDAKANTEDELKNSYVGKVILDCQVCHSKQYKDKEDVVLDDTHTLANVGEECPYCYTSDGFKVIGEVVEFPAEEEKDDDDEEEEKEAELSEGIFDSKKTKQKNYSEDIKAVFQKDERVITSEVISNADEVLSEVADTIGEDSQTVNLAKSVISMIKNAKQTVSKTPQSLVKSIISLGQKYSPNSTSLSDLKEFISMVGKLQTASKTGYKAMQYLFDMINDALIKKIDNEVSWLKKEYGIVEKVLPKAVIKTNHKSQLMHEDLHVYEESDLTDFDFWGPARDTVSHLDDDDISTIASELEDMYPEGMDKTDVNDLFAYDEDSVANFLGYDTFEELIADREGVDESLREGINNVTLTTDDSHVEIAAGDDGKVVTVTEPIHSEEVIAPVQPETEKEIEDEEEEEEMVDVDIDDFDNDTFDELGEKYLKKVYENVKSYRTTSVSSEGNHLVVEGIIKFTSGKVSPTSFLFESTVATKDGKVCFVGKNKNITRGNKAFTVIGSMNENKLMVESFKYNYMTKDATGKSSRVYGNLKKK